MVEFYKILLCLFVCCCLCNGVQFFFSSSLVSNDLITLALGFVLLKNQNNKKNIFSNGRENAVEHWSVCILCYRHFKNIRLVHWEYTHMYFVTRKSSICTIVFFFARSVYLSTYKIPFDLNLYSFSYSIWFFVCFSFSYLNFLVFNMMNTMLIGIESYLTYITYNKIKITTETGWIRNEFVVIFFSRYFTHKEFAFQLCTCV